MNNPSNNQATAIGIDPKSQSVIIIFPRPTSHLALSIEQAEALANKLMENVRLVRVQQSN